MNALPTEFILDWTGTLCSKLDRSPAPDLARTLGTIKMDPTSVIKIVSVANSDLSRDAYRNRWNEILAILNGKKMLRYVSTRNITVIEPPKTARHFEYSATPEEGRTRQFIVGDRPCREIQVGNGLSSAITVLIRDPKVSICTEEPLTGEFDGEPYNGVPHFTFSSLYHFAKWIAMMHFSNAYDMMYRDFLDAMDRDAIPAQLEMYHKMLGVGPVDENYLIAFSCFHREPEKTKVFKETEKDARDLLDLL